MKKKGIEFIGTSRINISDEDLIARPHGFVPQDESIVKALHNLTKEIKRTKNKTSKELAQKTDTTEKVTNSSSNAISIRDLRKELSMVKKTIKLGNKEKDLLNTLSDFKPHETKILVQTTRQALRQLKRRLLNKLKGTGFFIVMIETSGLFPRPCYKLDYSRAQKKDT